MKEGLSTKDLMRLFGNVEDDEEGALGLDGSPQAFSYSSSIQDNASVKNMEVLDEGGERSRLRPTARPIVRRGLQAPAMMRKRRKRDS